MTNYIGDIIGNIWKSTDIANNLNYICDTFGPRPSGSESLNQTGDYIKQKLDNYGLETHKHRFEHNYWEKEKATLFIDGQLTSAIPFHFSKSDDLTGECYILNNPSERTFENAKFKGKILLVSPSKQRHGGMGRKVMFKKAVEGEALAFIQMSGIPGGVLETGSIGNDFTEIPAFSCSYETGKRVERLQKRGMGSLSLSVKGRKVEKVTHNIIGDLQGKTDNLIISGAHYDTWDIGPGAFDNGTGISTVLGLAEAISKSSFKEILPSTLRFILFSGEELGILGSEAYAKDYIDDKEEKTSLMCNYDCTNIKGGVRGAFTSNDMKMHKHIVDFVKDNGFDMRMSLRPPHGTDAIHFSERKIPTFGLAQFTAPSYMHTAFDTPDKVDISGLKNSTAIAGAVLVDMVTNEII